MTASISMADPAAVHDPVPGARAAEARVREVIHAHGPREAAARLLAENDALIRTADLDVGRTIVTARSAIYAMTVADWAAEQHAALGYDKPFAVVALGGSGRAEMTPCSDLDFALLFDDALEGNPFLLELQRQLLHSDTFAQRTGFACPALPFSLEGVPDLAEKQLNSFLDMRPVYDPTGLAAVFRERIRATADSFAHFLHVRGFWKDQWEKAAGESERLDRFDVKNEGLRLFLAGVWTLAGQRFVHSHDIYRTLEDGRDLEAYEFLLRVRTFVHDRQRRRGRKARPSADGNHVEDVLEFDDFMAFGEMLGPEADEAARHEFANVVRTRVLSARRRVARFARAIIEQELHAGRPVTPGSAIVFGVGGLAHRAAPVTATPREKSRAALGLLLAAQHYEVPIDPSELATTFRGAGDWLERVPELSALFHEPRGSLADSFAFLAQIDGAEDRLFPGYAKFEASLDGRVMAEHQTMRGVFTREKLRVLEQFLRDGQAQLAGAVSPERLTDLSQGVRPEIETALLDADHLAAVRLALKTKRLPVTPEDEAVRNDMSRPLHERLSTGMSGIPLAEYYDRFRHDCEIPRETLAITEFLVAHRRAFKDRARTGLNDAEQVAEFARLCGEEQRLRALFVFTCADRAAWESERTDPTRWFNTRELYTKTMMRFRPARDARRALDAAGYSPEQLAVLQDFGEDFFAGVYRQYANRFGSHLVRLAETPEETAAKTAILRDGASIIVGVAARDYRGLAATITGALWHHGLDLRQAHLFSAGSFGLALDFFHLAPNEQALPPELARAIEEAIRDQRHIGEADEANLPRVAGTATLRDWRADRYCLHFETTEETRGLVYALAYKVFFRLRGNIFGLTAHAARGRVFVSIYLSLPEDLPLDEARTIAAKLF